MPQNNVQYDRFDEHFSEAFSTDIATADRITSIVTESIPPRFPGRLLLSITDVSPKLADGTRPIDAAIAIEFAFLHQYLHAIPRYDGPFVPMVSSSEYVDDSTAAVLDGDLLQACAFTRLATTAKSSDTIHRCYQVLARGSIECYERVHNTDVAIPFAPLVGVGARIGAILAGVERTAADEIERSARSLTDVVPVPTPVIPESDSGIDDGDIDATIREYSNTVSNVLVTTKRLDPILKDAIEVGQNR